MTTTPDSAAQGGVTQALEQALAWAYIQGAHDVHAYWLDNPGAAPRGDPEFEESASDYAKEAVDPLSSKARVPNELLAVLSPPAQQAGVEDAQREVDAACHFFREYQSKGAFTISADVVGCGRVTITVGPRAALRPSTDAAAPSEGNASSTSGLTDGGDRLREALELIALTNWRWKGGGSETRIRSAQGEIAAKVLGMPALSLGSPSNEEHARINDLCDALAQPDAVTSGMPARSTDATAQPIGEAK